MAWARKIYVATLDKGIYFTNNFTDPSIQPIWNTVNDGLPTETYYGEEFHLDPFHPEDRQYFLTGNRYLGGHYGLFMRHMEGAWVEILSGDNFAHACGWDESYLNSWMFGFCTDPTIEGRLWIVGKIQGPDRHYGPFGDAPYYEIRAVYTDDYGETWNSIPTWWSGWNPGTPTSIRTYGDTLYVRDGGGVGDRPYIEYSYNRGVSWNYVDTDLVQYTLGGFLNPLTPERFYYDTNGVAFRYFENGSLYTTINGIKLGDSEWDTIWYNPDDSLHMKLIYDNHIWTTYDGWDTASGGGEISTVYHKESISPYAGDNPDYIILGMRKYSGWEVNHPSIGTLYGETDTNLIPIAGTNWNTYPYTNSIPANSVPCRCGIQGVQRIRGYVYVNAVAHPSFAEDIGEGIPMKGDRSAWNTKYFRGEHTNDIDSGSSTSIHHTLSTSYYIDRTTGSYKAAPGIHAHYFRGMDSGSSLPGEILTSLGSGSSTWRALTSHTHSGSIAGDGGRFSADHISSGSAPVNSVLTNNVSGILTWELIDDWRISLVQNENLNASVKEFIVPENIEWQLLWAWVEYTSTITSGSRQLQIQILDSGSNVISEIQAGILQDNNLTYKYLFGMVLPDLTTIRDGGYLMTPLPSGTYVTAGQKIRVWDTNTIDSLADDMLVRLQYAYHPISVTYVQRNVLSPVDGIHTQNSDNIRVLLNGILIVANSIQIQTPSYIDFTPQGGLYTTYYVDSVDGDDGNDGSYSTPWKTIAKVNSATLSPDDHILFRRGQTFVGRIYPSYSGTSGHPIVYGAYGSGNRPIIDGSANNAFYVSFDGNNHHHINAENIDFSGSLDRIGDYTSTVVCNTHDMYFYNCIFRDSDGEWGSGFSAYGHTGLEIYNVIIDSCEGYNNHSSGISITSADGDGPYNCEVKNCICHDNGTNIWADHGIYVRYGCTVHDSICYNNTYGGGIKINSEGIDSPYSPIVYNNNCYDNLIGIYCVHQNALIYNNCFYSNQYNVLFDPDSHDMTFVFNTIINADNVSGYTPLYITANVYGNTIKNNLFIQDWSISPRYMFRGTSSAYMEYFVANNDINYNVYFTNGNTSTGIFYDTDSLYSWAQWKALYGSPDVNSTFLTPASNFPDFVTRYTDLRPEAGGNLDGRGTYIDGDMYEKDIDGNTRTYPVTPGAYEPIAVPVTYTIPIGTSLVNGFTNYSFVKPGDILELEPGTRGTLHITNMIGTLGNPITIRNGNGASIITSLNPSSDWVGIYLENLNYVHFTGGAYSYPYGIIIDGVRTLGIFGEHKIDNFEIDHVEFRHIIGSNVALHIMTDASGGGDYDYDGDGILDPEPVNNTTYTSVNYLIHDNHWDGGDGVQQIDMAVYIGNSNTLTSTTEPRLQNIEFYNNLIDNMADKAVQFGAVESGLKIHDNIITNSCTVGWSDQEAININEGCTGVEIYNNWLQDINGCGIRMGGEGGIIYNNLIVDCGDSTTYWDAGILVNYRGGYSHSEDTQVLNNTIINPAGDGIEFGNTYGTITIQNNIIVNPGHTYIDATADTESNNLETMVIADCGFVNVAGDDYHLAVDSVAIDAGGDVSAFGITVDKDNNPRPVGEYDQGAYEYQG
jgi:hypothetical protein